MGNIRVFDDLIEEKLMSMHTAYIGKVTKYKDGLATIQPLNMIKQYGKSAEKQSVIPNVPVIQSARYKLKLKTINPVTDISSTRSNGYVTSVTEEKTKYTILEPTEIKAGDIVLCVCCDRDITESKNGNMATPPIGHHSMSDSLVVGIL